MMTRENKVGFARLLWIGGIVLTVTVTAVILVGWRMSYVNHVAWGQAEKSFTIPIEFGEFRRIMVRQNATKAIIAKSGMTLLEEKIIDFKVDTSRDNRPVINALLGRSKSHLTASKLITVKLDDPELEANKLSLIQQAEIKNAELEVRTEANHPAGKLDSYSTNLRAWQEGDITAVSFTIKQGVRVWIPSFLKATADNRVQTAAEEAVDKQEQSIKDFIAECTQDFLVLAE